MTLSTLWVVAEPSSGSFTHHLTRTAEPRSHARLPASRRSPGASGGSLAALAGEYGATTLYDVGDLGGALPGVPVASAIEALDRERGRARRDPRFRRATTVATSRDDCRPDWTDRS